MLAHLESRDARTERRGSDRYLLKLRVPGSTPSERSVAVLIHDLSLTGFLIETSADLSVGAELEIQLPEAGTRHAWVVWNSGQYFGCEFLEPISRGGLSAALLKSPADGHPADPAGGEFWDEEPKLPLRTRFLIMISLALTSWAIILTAFSLIF